MLLLCVWRPTNERKPNIICRQMFKSTEIVTPNYRSFVAPDKLFHSTPSPLLSLSLCGVVEALSGPLKLLLWSTCLPLMVSIFIILYVCCCQTHNMCLMQLQLTHLDVLAEHVVGVQNDGAEVSDGIEFEYHFDGFPIRSVGVISPAHPLVTCRIRG